MIKLWKYEIERKFRSTLKVPVGTRVLKVGIQGDELDPADQISDAYMLSVQRGVSGVEFKVVLWALAPVNPSLACEAEHGEVEIPIFSIATGAEVPSVADLYLGTVQLPGVDGQACFSIFTSKGLGVTKE